jgi:hypothetical protein
MSSASPTPSDPPALFGDDRELPEEGITIVMYVQSGSSPEVLSITNGRKDPSEGMEYSGKTADDLYKRLMTLKYTDTENGAGKRKKRKTQNKKRSNRKTHNTRKSRK